MSNSVEFKKLKINIYSLILPLKQYIYGICVLNTLRRPTNNVSNILYKSQNNLSRQHSITFRLTVKLANFHFIKFTENENSPKLLKAPKTGGTLKCLVNKFYALKAFRE